MCLDDNVDEKSAQRDANTARVLAVVRFGHLPLARSPATKTHTHTHTHTNRHCAAS